MDLPPKILFTSHPTYFLILFDALVGQTILLESHLGGVLDDRLARAEDLKGGVFSVVDTQLVAGDL